MLSLIKMNVNQDFKSLSYIMFGCSEIYVILTEALKYAIIYKEKFWRLIGKAVKPYSGETIQELSNTAVADINCFCIEFNASVAKKILQYLLHFAHQNQLKVFKKLKHLEIIEKEQK